MECDICNFENPKGCVSAVIIHDGKLLVLKRTEKPFKNMWDLPGGYMDASEMPDQTVKREIKEELGVDAQIDYIGCFPGTASWNAKIFPIISHAYLVELEGEPKLNTSENSSLRWIPISEANPKEIAFDSNVRIVEYIKSNFSVNFGELKTLIAQLDVSAVVKEINLYRSILNGYMSRKYVDGKLVGVGWIFPRRTFLRKQAVIEDVIVDNSQRGKGYGKEITLDLMRWAKENGIEVIELTSGSHRVAANELYKKVGFKLHPTNHYLYTVE